MATIDTQADLGATGLAASAGFVVYNLTTNAVVYNRAASVSGGTIRQVPGETVYSGSFSGTYGIRYMTVWDDGAGNKAKDIIAPLVNVAAIADQPSSDHDGTTRASSTSSAINLGSTDANANTLPNATANQAIRIIRGTGIGQVIPFASLTGSSGSRVGNVVAGFPVSPVPDTTSDYIWETQASGGTVTLGSTAPAGWIDAAAIAAGAITTAKFAAGATIPRVTLTDTATTLTTPPTVSLGSTAPAGWINTAAFAAGATIPRVTLADTATNLTNSASFSLGTTAPVGWLTSSSFAAGTTIPRVTLADTATTLTNSPTFSLGSTAPANWINAAAVATDAVTKLQANLATAAQIPANFTTALFASAGVFSANALVNATNSDSPGTTTLVSRLTSTRAGYLDMLNGGVNLNLAQTGYTPRQMDSLADNAITTGDCMVSAFVEVAGRESIVGQAYVKKTPGTQTIVSSKTLTLNADSEPTARN